jgi:biopolymer transport protein ExbD
MKPNDLEDEAITGLNITPLVDVILVLLIIFMASAPLIQRRTLKVNVPKVAHSQPRATQTLNVVLNEKQEIFLGEELIRKEDLSYQLSAFFRSDPSLHIAVSADQTVSYGQVAELLDLIRGVGIQKVALEVRSKKQ